MAEPSFVASGAYLEGSGTSAAVAVPAGTAAGRVALVAIFMDGNPLAVNPTPPTGFALAPGAPVQIPATSGSHSLYLYWKRLAGADAGTWTFTWAEGRYREAQAHLYTDVVATGTPFDPSPGAAFDTTSSTITPAVSCASAGPDRRLIFTATNWGGGTWTAPTSHTKRMQGGAGVITLTDRSWPTASSTGSVTATCTSSDKRNAWLGALIGTTPDSSGISGELAASLPALGATVDGTATVTGTAAATLPSLTATAAGTATVAGQVSATLPALGAELVAAATVAGQATAALPALTGAATGTATVTGQPAAVLPALTGHADGSVTARAALAAGLPALSAALEGTAETAGGLLAATLPPLGGSLQAAARATGGLAGTLPALTGQLDASARTAGALAAGLPALTATVQGDVIAPTGILAARLPSLTGALTGTSAATDLPDATMHVGAPALGWPVSRPHAGWPVKPARTGWNVRPPHLGE